MCWLLTHYQLKPTLCDPRVPLEHLHQELWNEPVVTVNVTGETLVLKKIFPGLMLGKYLPSYKQYIYKYKYKYKYNPLFPNYFQTIPS